MGFLPVAAFQADGAVCLRQVLTPGEVADLRAGIELNLSHLSPRAKLASAADDPGRFVEDFCTWRDNPHYRRIVADTSLARIAAGLMQSATARFYHDHMLTKEPGTRQRTPWHQDQPYYNIEGRQNVSFWIPVDPVDRASTLEFVLGSHRGPWFMPRSFVDSQARWFPAGSLLELPDLERHRDDFRIEGWALEPGDLVAFHMLTLHASQGVDGPRRRRVFSARFIGDDIRHAPRPWQTSPEFEGLSGQLAVGDSMDHPLFPLFWPETATQARGSLPHAAASLSESTSPAAIAPLSAPSEGRSIRPKTAR